MCCFLLPRLSAPSLSHPVCVRVYYRFLPSRDAHSCFPSSLSSSLGQLSFLHLGMPGTTWKHPRRMIASTLSYALKNISWELLIDPEWGILPYKAICSWWRNVEASFPTSCHPHLHAPSACWHPPNQAHPWLAPPFLSISDEADFPISATRNTWSTWSRQF